jgi:hypothetical protein
MPTQYNPPVTEFLTKEQRAEWYQKKQKFFVVEACEVPGQFGRSARYKLRPVNDSGEAGDEVYLSFTLTDQNTGAEIARRVDELAWFVSVLADDSVGPMVLEQVATSKGNPAWSFKAVK